MAGEPYKACKIEVLFTPFLPTNKVIGKLKFILEFNDKLL
ncbi:hypothetical protein AMCSP12_000464 [Streptococcus pneumoniae 2070108]|nr:hypothetical protein SPAR91_0531 [Streptococcus pneumoniae GA47283]EHZ40091.1 hypothetical protein SPAR62_0501 [Streptococcus pneumoniae GA40028]EJG41469.1 hypothetical protein AMCSP12_000464 [Streptococcus pneumoniae 2070108]EJG75538.1 hypothetical protein AMCSP19_000508 [Streptococcus pneumoniae 2082239]